MPQILLIPLAVALLFLVAFLLFRTALFTSSEEPVEPVTAVDVDSRLMAEHLARLIRCETVASLDPEKLPKKAFRTLHKELELMYPRVHRLMDIEVVSDYSLLYTWHGADLDLKPILLMGHQDVVPADVEATGGWEHPPFSGEIADGFVWGRGTLDDKFCLTGILEAAERLLQDGFKPARTIYLAFGHDEETGGRRGAACIAAMLAERQVEIELVLDEGGMLTSGILPGVEKTIALIGVAEKGDLLLELRAEAQAGHSSAPPQETAIGKLARAITRLSTHPMHARLDGIYQMFAPLASELPLQWRFILANRWLFGGLLKRQFERAASTNAMIRTTLVPTMLKGGIKENVIPGQASAAVDARLLPGDRLPEVFDHVRKVVGSDGIQIRSLYPEPAGLGGVPGTTGVGAWEASPVTDPQGTGFRMLAQTIREVYPESAVTPYVLSGATDSRYFTTLSSQVLRFAPVRFLAEDIQRVHGVNERLAVKACGDLVRFYRQFILNLAG
ncbi:MAG: M20 family peptidase [Anaerolineaceae bacterium]|nr:M20 family peptidase [Anaerolineaceae bacterium]